MLIAQVAAAAPDVPPPAYEQQKLQQDYGITSGWANQVTSLLSGVGSSYSALAQQEAQAVATAINGLPALRAEATGTKLPTLVVIQQYANTINTLLALDNQVAVGSNDSTLAATARVVGLVSAIKEEASEQQAILTSALDDNLVGVQAGQFGPSQQTAITDAEAEQQGNQAEFNTAATAAQRALFNGALSASAVARAQAQEQAAISLASSGSPIATDPTVVDATTSQYYVVSSLRSVEQNLAGSVIARSTALRNDAITSAIIWSIAVLLVLVLTLIFMTIIGRSMVRPLRKLRAGALEVAGQRLPETVRRMSETDGEGVPLDVEPIDVDSSDEIGEVARAFDQVHREALRLAANEAALRGNVNAMFVNLSRRSQSLVERQIRLIDDLEQGEQDPERLSSLFQMDHLATRMRRNSENLLVLAGHEESRRWNQPLALVDVLRASLSEIEHYERVTLNVQPGIVVRGQVVSDVVHLTAELVENATSFSAAETPVTIAGHLLSSGGALLEITDQGVGMGAEEMAHANWRLDNPPVVDVAVSRRMGLFVVARLAARHGIRVRLRSADPIGLIALVWLPDEVITRESPDGPLRLRPDPVAPMSLVPGPASGDDSEGSERFAVERELSAARAPRFASLRSEADDTNPDLRQTPVPVLGAGRDGGRGAGRRWSMSMTRRTPRPGWRCFRTAPPKRAGCPSSRRWSPTGSAAEARRSTGSAAAATAGLRRPTRAGARPRSSTPRPRAVSRRPGCRSGCRRRISSREPRLRRRPQSRRRWRRPGPRRRHGTASPASSVGSGTVVPSSAARSPATEKTKLQDEA